MSNLDKFLTDTRERPTTSEKSEEDPRNPFENDYARVLFSSSFRRLQDKTQVFPLKREDFVRTRLTHSLEVSTFGRSIGISVEDRLIKENKLSEEKRGYLPSLLATAGLIHDLGNPPFGHFGETAIMDYFEKFKFKDKWNLNEQQKADLQKFDGNVQTVRALSRLQYLKDEFGVNLTLATIAMIMKYPFNSLDGNKGGEKNNNFELSKKKFGYFYSEKSIYDKIKKEFSHAKRYPFTFLLEVADDIAYSVADIEDGCKKGIVGENVILEVLKDNCNNDNESEQKLINKYQEYIDSVHKDYKHKNELAVQQFRIDAQGFMIRAVVKEFVENINGIIDGTYDKDLLENSDAKNIRKAFKSIAGKIFENKKIIKNELIGYRVIQSLLDELIPAVLDFDGEDENIKDPQKNRILSLISSNYRFVFAHFSKKDIYSRIQLAVDYICGMTDSFALKLYHELRGHN